MRRIAGIVVVWVCSTIVLSPLLLATEQSTPTILYQEDGKWRLKKGYIGGWAIYVENANGKWNRVVRISDALPEEDYKKFVHQTTAGPDWAGNALRYFITLNGKPHFGIRTWWGRRILIDLEVLKQIPDAPFDAILAKHEKKRTLDTLKDGVALITKWPRPSRGEIDSLHAAIHFSGLAKLKGAIPFLEQLEPMTYRSYTYRGKFIFSVYGTRRLAQLALRRLGQKPACYPATSPSSGRRKALRHKRIHDLEPGMTPGGVRYLLGSPDYYERAKGWWRYAWRYDMDADEPYTLLVVWDDDKRVKTVEQIKPPLWKGNILVRPGVKGAVLYADGELLYSSAKALKTDDFLGTITQIKP